MTKLCIIPARGGSKRISRKNIKDFLGKPIIAYSIEAAFSSKLFDEVMVSTDDEEIAEVAKKYGATVPFFRSKKTSDDFATTFDVVEEVLSTYANNGQVFSCCCCLYACAPLIQVEKLQDAFKLLSDGKYDSVIPVGAFSFPIQRAVKLKNERLMFVNPEFEFTRSQDLEKTYHDAGQFYFLNSEAILSKNKLFSNNTGSIILNEIFVQDIDNETDWTLAELKYKMLFENEKL